MERAQTGNAGAALFIGVLFRRKEAYQLVLKDLLEVHEYRELPGVQTVISLWEDNPR